MDNKRKQKGCSKMFVPDEIDIKKIRAFKAVSNALWDGFSL